MVWSKIANGGRGEIISNLAFLILISGNWIGKVWVL